MAEAVLYCLFCGLKDCRGCGGPFEAPRFCPSCGGRLKVQVLPFGVQAQCKAHGPVDVQDRLLDAPRDDPSGNL